MNTVELGLGGIRDSIADQFLPTTSTLQARLSYLDTAASAFPAVGRQSETCLLSELLVKAPKACVIGLEAGNTLARLPR